MSTLNGFGTLYYGWRHDADGTATATTWIALSWVPIIPLRRERLRVLTDFHKPKGNIKAVLGGLIASQADRYEIIERLPLSPKEVLVTLAKTYIGLPLLLFGPMLLVVLVMTIARKIGIRVEPDSPAFNFFIASAILILVNFLLQAVRAIRRARGWQPNLPTR